MKAAFIIAGFAILFAGCKPEKQPEFSSVDISTVISKMTDIMIHDVTNPPLAARFFAYATLAGYEVIAENNKDFKSMHGVLNEYPELHANDSVKGYSYQLSALLAIMKTAGKMQPSGTWLSDYEKKFLDSCKIVGFDEEVIEKSNRYADIISKKILAYAKADRYNKISNYPRYTPSGKDGAWFPTPPAFISAVEPYFHTVRPFALDSMSQYKPAPPTTFSLEKNSAFMQLVMQNYKDTLTSDQKEIAAFWDCNPFAVQDKGHLMMSSKKISPGAHWLGITGIACKNANKSFDESMLIYTTVSIGLMDAFMSCWHEKYESDRVRPETAIRKYVDPNWVPMLQTPPFPEYPSGHSTISAASSVILSHYFGNNFSYTDTVEVSWGLPARSFTSFRQAATEAGISRFYGGIHFMDAIDNGNAQGTKVGEWVIKKMNGIEKTK